MKTLLAIAVLSLAVGVGAPAVMAQGTVKSGPDPSTVRDPELEKIQCITSKSHETTSVKKAHVAALKRAEEIIAGNPNFTRIDEALFIAGSSSFSLAQNKGKQVPSLYISYDGNTKKTLTAEEFREMGRDYLTRLITDYPDSSFVGRRHEALKVAGGARRSSRRQ